MTTEPLALYTPLPPRYKLTDPIDALVAVLTGGERNDCNAAAKVDVTQLEMAFDGIVERVRGAATSDNTLDHVNDFVYYAIMEQMGHGVGLGDFPDRWSEEDAEKARDKDGPINPLVRRLVSWAEANMESYPSVYTLRVRARVSVITEESAADGDEEMSFSIPATPTEIRDWKSWIDGYSLVPDEDRAEDEPPCADGHGPMECAPLDFTRLLDEIGAEFRGLSSWRVCAGDQELLAEFNYRRLPGVQRADESWHDVIGASLELFVEVVKFNDEDPDFDAEGIEAGRDSYFKRHAKTAPDAAKES